MEARTKMLVLLLFLSPMIGELLSGSAPPLEFFSPLTVLVFLMLYGCGTLLIREARVRWGLQWSVVFLSAAYGIIEEGLCVKSFFNPGWVDMGALSAYGMFLGVQWPWTISLIVYHGIMSTLVPILIVDMLFPQNADRPLVGRKGIVIALLCITFLTVWGMTYFGTVIGGVMVPFNAHPALMIGGLASVLALIWLAHRFRRSRIASSSHIVSPWVFGVFGGDFMFANLLIPDTMARMGIDSSIAILSQLVLIGLAALFVKSQLLNERATKRHTAGLVTGIILMFVLLTPIMELNGGRHMVLTGAVTLLLLIAWRRNVLNNNVLL